MSPKYNVGPRKGSIKAQGKKKIPRPKGKRKDQVIDGLRKPLIYDRPYFAMLGSVLGTQC